MQSQDFCKQVVALASQYEMATLESALEFVHGTYMPARDLCLLTFDDGLKEHYSEITPLLMNRGIQGVFFVITSCIGADHIAPVHMNHFLLAALNFDDYRGAFLQRLAAIFPDAMESIAVEPSLAQNAYRWDKPEVANFKYLFNFVLDGSRRDLLLEELFKEKIGDIPSFARELYLNEEEAKQMQAAGMIIGGHSHRHHPLSLLSDDELETDLNTCHQILVAKLYSQVLWPFCYPYGQRETFNDLSIALLRQIGFSCAFSTESGTNRPGSDKFAIHRIDCNEATK
jgi:hypothetical protein